jgi:predicted DNA-binding transcriptional regulator AlpA
MAGIVNIMGKQEEREWMTIGEVSALTGIPVNTLYNMNAKGTAPPRYRFTKRLHYRRPEVVAWMKSHAVEPGQTART